MKLLSFYLGRHDSNLCLFDFEKSELRYAKSERLLNIKRHAADLEFVVEFCRRLDFVPDVVAYSDGNRNGLGACPPNSVLFEVDCPPVFPDAKWYNIDHHFAHVFSAWPITDLDDVSVGIVVDGQGDHLRRVSVFRNPREFGSPVFASTEHQVGHFFVQIGLTLKLAGQLDDYAGKIMGAQAYGKANDLLVGRLLQTEIERDLFRLFRTTHWNGNPINSSFYDFDNPCFRDWLATAHSVCGEIILGIFRGQCSSNEKIVYSGGVALNTVINDRIRDEFPNTIIPPNCYDGGLSIGILEVVRRFLGLPPLNSKGFPFLQSDDDFGEASYTTIKNAAQMLANGKIVGWLQGHGEVGPRALGHRSILVQASGHDTKDLLNSKVKNREYWRPFAPSILYRSQIDYVSNSLFSPFMLYTAPVAVDSLEKIPAVVHVDGTTRYQSVDSGRCEGLLPFQVLLEEFENLTGTPVLLNTSFNAGGKPIVAKKADAIDFFRVSGMDALILGDETFVKS